MEVFVQSLSVMGSLASIASLLAAIIAFFASSRRQTPLAFKSNRSQVGDAIRGNPIETQRQHGDSFFGGRNLRIGGIFINDDIVSVGFKFQGTLGLLMHFIVRCKSAIFAFFVLLIWVDLFLFGSVFTMATARILFYDYCILSFALMAGLELGRPRQVQTRYFLKQCGGALVLLPTNVRDGATVMQGPNFEILDRFELPILIKVLAVFFPRF